MAIGIWLLPGMKPCHLDARDFANSPKPNPDPAGSLEVIGIDMAWNHRIRNNGVLGVLVGLVAVK
jgi:hypothetical protein